MGAKLLKLPPELLRARDQFEIFDGFGYFIDADLWTKLDADVSSTVAHEGAGRSNISLLTSVDNEEAALATTNELFKFIAEKSIMVESAVQFTKPNTDDGSAAFGLADAFGADLILDNGTAPSINDSGALIYTLKDETVWRFVTSIGGTAVTSLSTKTAGGAAYQTLRIEIQPRSSTVFVARPYVDGVQLEDSNGIPISHDITLGTATDMDLGLYIKGHHADDFTLLGDYIYGGQVR